MFDNSIQYNGDLSPESYTTGFFHLNTGVGKSRFTVVPMEKDMQLMIITTAKRDKS
jgi:hypothetical protein